MPENTTILYARIDSAVYHNIREMAELCGLPMSTVTEALMAHKFGMSHPHYAAINRAIIRRRNATRGSR